MNTFTIDRAALLEKMKSLARSREGECLSNEYKNSQTKLRWRCKNGHEWEAVPNSVSPRKGFKGSWCAFCIGRLPKNSALEDLKELAKKRGGELLSKRYKNARSHLLWRCAKGHEWRATSDSVKRASWCPVCGGRLPLTLTKMREQALSFGGKCVSKEYKNTSTPLVWRCAQGHEWKAKPSHVLAGHWCPTCASGVSERICRAIFEGLTGKKFPKSRPRWLRNERGFQMELDGYAPELDLAFEYHGQQHYRHVTIFHTKGQTLEQRQADDRRKVLLCREHGVKLFEIPIHVPMDELQYFIRVKLQSAGAKILDAGGEPIFERLGLWKSHELERLQKIAKQHGGKLLSKIYVNESTKMRWRCASGHRWRARPHDIKRGAWCVVCARQRNSEAKLAKTLQKVQEIAEKKGGKCLSKKHRCGREKLSFRCGFGHQWKTMPDVIKRGFWCPKCARNVVAKKLALSIDDMRAVASQRGGLCLSNTYIDSHHKLTWRCAKGHSWKATGNAIRSAQWCPKCGLARGAEKRRIRTFQKVCTVAKERGGICLSGSYNFNHEKLKFKCSTGHTWQADVFSMLRGAWCPTCARQFNGMKRRLTLDEIKKSAEKRGGVCLSENYKNCGEKLLWQCRKGHVWTATVEGIRSGTWCPTCVGKKAFI